MTDRPHACFTRWAPSIFAAGLPAAARERVMDIVDELPAQDFPIEIPRSPRARREANEAALAAAFSPTGKVGKMMRYSGWGGLSLSRPPEIVVEGRAIVPVTSEALEHDYYTPFWLAFELSVVLRQFGIKPKTALEPSAGCGRLILPWVVEGIAWTAVEQQRGAAQITRRLLEKMGAANVIHEQPFELFAVEAARQGQRFDLIVENPPYGSRPHRYADPEFAKVTQAQWYFLLRSAGLLSEGGILAAIVPSGVLTGGERQIRAKLLQEVELLAAWGLPADVFSDVGARLNVDLLVFRKRRGAWTATDDLVLKGKYFQQHPEMLLGEVKGSGKGRWGQLRTGWRGCLPRARNRPVPRQLTPFAEEWGRSLKDRADRGSWEWQLDVAAWREHVGPTSDPEWIELQAAPPPVWTAERAARLLYAAQDPVTTSAISSRTELAHERIVEQLLDADWLFLAGEWFPPLDLFWGSLRRLLEAAQLENNEDVIAFAQERMQGDAQDAIASSFPFEDWIPATLIRQWVQQMAGPRAVALNVDGTWVVPGQSFLTAVLNNDPGVFENLEADQRASTVKSYLESWREFILSDPHYGQATTAYLGAYRGWLMAPEDKSPAEQEIPRWAFDVRRPHWYQWSVARRARDQGRMLFAWAVGLGKTTGVLLTMAWMRASGFARRPIIIVPPAVLGAWLADIRAFLPDFRVGVVGQEFDDLGVSKGTDDQKQRLLVWEQFRAGALDVVLLTYPALSRFRFNVEEDALPLLEDPAAVRTFLSFQREEIGGRVVRQIQRSATERAVEVDRNELLGYLRMLLKEGSGDPVRFGDLGADFLAFDEAHMAKSSFAPGVDLVNGGQLMYVGGAATPSQTAWRALCLARDPSTKFVMLATATPATNGLGDFYCVTSLLGQVWPDRDLPSWIKTYVEERMEAKETSSGQVTMRSAAAGIQRASQFFGIIQRWSSFLRQKDVNIKLPEAEPEQVPVPAQEYLGALEAEYSALLEAFKARDSASMMAIRTRLTLLAVHRDLVIPTEPPQFAAWDEAQREAYRAEMKARTYPVEVRPSPKFRAIRQRLTVGCGHLIFLDYLQAQVWLRDYLRKEGFTVEIISGEVKPGDRQLRAAAFREGKIQVLILGPVGGTGLNLQTNTCAVHHVVPPWTPAELEQRTGRARRQGNDLDAVAIYYYLMTPSADSLRLQVITGKTGWLTALVGEDPTSNPAAGSEVSVVELLASISLSPEWDKQVAQLREMTEAARKVEKEQARWKLITHARALTRNDQPVNFSINFIYPTVEQAGLSAETVIQLNNGQNFWLGYPGLSISTSGITASGDIYVIERVSRDSVWLRRRGGFALVERSPTELSTRIWTEPASLPAEDVEGLRDAAVADNFVEWRRLSSQTIDRVWTGGEPAYRPIDVVPRSDGQAVSAESGAVVAPTPAGYEFAAALLRGPITAHLQRQWWGKQLPPVPNKAERAAFQKWLDGDVAAVRKIWPEDGTQLASQIRLPAPYGGLQNEQEELPGPRIGERTNARSVPALDGPADDFLVFARVTTSSQLLDSGVYGGAILVADGLWRPVIGTEDNFLRGVMWLGGAGLPNDQQALAVSRSVWGRFRSQLNVGEPTGSIVIGQRLIARIALSFRRQVVLGVTETLGYRTGAVGALRDDDTGRSWSGHRVASSGNPVPLQAVAVTELAALVGTEDAAIGLREGVVLGATPVALSPAPVWVHDGEGEVVEVSGRQITRMAHAAVGGSDGLLWDATGMIAVSAVPAFDGRVAAPTFTRIQTMPLLELASRTHATRRIELAWNGHAWGLRDDKVVWCGGEETTGSVTASAVFPVAYWLRTDLGAMLAAIEGKRGRYVRIEIRERSIVFLGTKLEVKLPLGMSVPLGEPTGETMAPRAAREFDRKAIVAAIQSALAENGKAIGIVEIEEMADWFVVFGSESVWSGVRRRKKKDEDEDEEEGV